MSRGPAALLGFTVLSVLVTACAAGTSTSTSPAASPAVSSTASPGPSVPGQPAHTAPKLIIEREDELYPVGGLSPAVVAMQIRSRGPGRFAGLTTYVTTYDWSEAPLPSGRCRLASPVVHLAITVTLPEMSRRTSGAARAYAAGVIHDLRVHENGHVRLAVASGRTTLQSLADVRKRTFASCEELRTIAERRARHAVSAGQASQRAYDRRTHHGLAQWAA